ncbi:putative NRPS-like protein biosynthetic cluster [Cytospora paraplurivora]|uniref:NRPS-like protein biosynthetic cluster n=1 Tax=Cytospora paraplurivora TaxID=2898453 RepID=A0AAN9UBD6_9PEZI
MDAEHISKCLGELLPHTVDRLAREKPSAPYGLWPVAQASYEDGFRTIDYGQLANIVNGLAWWIKKNIGTSQNGEKVLAYVGPNDVRLTALLLASVKAGCVLFLPSPRNSSIAQQSLLTALNCQTLVTSEPTPPAGIAILESVKPRPYHLTIPSIDELLSQQHSLFSYEKSFEAGRWDPLFIIHTSGSTGMPKPKIFTQETGMRHIACSNQAKEIQPEAGSVEDFLQGKRLMVTMPPFHGAGLACFLFWAIPFGTIPIAPAAVGIVTAEGLLEALEQTPAEVAFLVPSVVVELAQDPELLVRCAKHLELILLRMKTHNPGVSGALVVGTRRFQAALLIELVASEGNKSLNTVQQAELIERIWPSVEEANRYAPAHARIEKALILILPVNLPLIRAGKGTVQRPASIAQYATAIDDLYANADAIDGHHDNGLTTNGQLVDLADAQSVNRFIRNTVASLRGLVGSETESTTFFERGMDSLMALQLLRKLRRGLHRPDLGLSTIYSNPTLSQLQDAITSRFEDTPSAKEGLSIEPLFKTYSELIQQIPKPTAATPADRASQNEPLTIILTGSTVRTVAERRRKRLLQRQG